MSQKRGPHFLGIGAPRCGTTWLHNMLRQHQDVWLPPLKEIHYFDSIDPPLRLHGVDRLGRRVQSQLWRRVLHYGMAALGPMAESYADRARPDLQWDRKYFSPGGSVEWYRGLFDAKLKDYQKVGEITPGYFILSEPTIRLIREQTEVNRLIVLLRDPIDGAWSGFGRKVREGQTRATEDRTDQVLGELLGPAILRRLYAQNLQRWYSVFPKEQLFIGYYEDLSERPAKLLDDICEFLDIPPVSGGVRARLTERVNTSKASRGEIPHKIELGLAQHLEADLAELSKLLGGYPSKWHQRALKVIADSYY